MIALIKKSKTFFPTNGINRPFQCKINGFIAMLFFEFRARTLVMSDFLFTLSSSEITATICAQFSNSLAPAFVTSN